MTETAERLAAIRARVNAATEGPWGVSGTHGHNQIGPPTGDGWCKACLETDARSNENAENDAEFVKHVREDIPWLLTQLYEARRLREDALAQRNQYGKELTKARIEIASLKTDLQNQIVPVEGTPLQRAAARARNMLRVVFPGTVEYARDVLDEALGDQQESEN